MVIKYTVLNGATCLLSFGLANPLLWGVGVEGREWHIVVLGRLRAAAVGGQRGGGAESSWIQGA